MRRSEFWIVLLLTVISAGLHFWRLSEPNHIVFDETYYAKWGHDYLEGKSFFDVHPPLGKLLIGLGLLVTQTNPYLDGAPAFGWRWLVALFGVLIVPLTYIIARKLFSIKSSAERESVLAKPPEGKRAWSSTSSRRSEPEEVGNRHAGPIDRVFAKANPEQSAITIAFLAALFVLLDGLLLVQTRTALLDSFLVTFSLAAFGAFLTYRDAPTRRWASGWLLFTGLFLGFALATKWTGLAAYLTIFLWYLAMPKRTYVGEAVFSRQASGGGAAWSPPKAESDAEEDGGRHAGATDRVLAKETASAPFYPRVHVLIFILAFFVIPAAIYIGSFAWNQRDMAFWPYLLDWHQQTWHFHQTLTATHPYASRWWSWLYLARPVWYEYNDRDGVVRGIIALGNPILWWASIPALLASAWLIVRRKAPELLLPLLAFFATYVPWWVIGRTQFQYYLTPSVPFLMIILAWWLHHGLAHSYHRVRQASLTLIILAVLTFVFFFPLLIGYPISPTYYRLHIWFQSWI